MDPQVGSWVPGAPTLWENKNASPFTAYSLREPPGDPDSRRPSKAAHQPLPRRRRWKAAAWGRDSATLGSRVVGELEGGDTGGCGPKGGTQRGWGCGRQAGLGLPALETFPRFSSGPQVRHVTWLSCRRTGPVYQPTSTISTHSAPEVSTLQQPLAPAPSTPTPGGKPGTKQVSLFTLGCFLSSCIHTWGSAPVRLQPPPTPGSQRPLPSLTHKHALSLVKVGVQGCCWGLLESSADNEGQAPPNHKQGPMGRGGRNHPPPPHQRGRGQPLERLGPGPSPAPGWGQPGPPPGRPIPPGDSGRPHPQGSLLYSG